MQTDVRTLLILGLAFVGSVVLIEALYYLWRSLNVSGNFRTRRRIRKLSAAGVAPSEIPSILRGEVLSSNAILNEIYLAIPRFHHLDRLLDLAFENVSITRYLLMSGFLGLTVFLLMVFVVKAVVSLALLAAILVALIIPYLILIHNANQYVTKFNAQLPDALDFICRSLRAGNPFSASMKAVSENMDNPIAQEFGATFDEIKYGIDTEEALTHLVERTGSDEIKYFATAVIIQRTTGGNLAKILDRLSAVIRARASTRREVAILAAEMDISAKILIALPFVTAGVITLIRPEYMAKLLETNTGLYIIGAQVVMMVVGYAVIRRMVNFRI